MHCYANARIIHRAELDHDGKLYSPLCFFLAAACRRLKTRLGVRYWQSALDNVCHLQKQLVKSRQDSVDVGLEMGTRRHSLKQSLTKLPGRRA